VNEFSETADLNEDSPVPEQPEYVVSSQLDASTEDAPLESTVSSGDSDTTEHVVEAPEPPKKPRVFISHKRDVALNDEIAMRLKTDLEPWCESIYLDLDMLIGRNYVETIEAELSNSDFMIVLISEEANQSGWIKTELDYANFYHQQKGSPTILPVRFGFPDHEPFNPRVNVHIADIQAVSYDPINDDYERDLLEPLRLAITLDSTTSSPERAEDRLAGFIVHESRRERLRAAFMEPSSLAGIRAELRDRKLLWIAGDAGVRNYLGLSLAVDEGRNRIYEVLKPLSWSAINSSVVSNSTIVFQDSTPAEYFDETTPKAELNSLRSLIKRNNTVIVTLSQEAFQDVEPELRKEAFEYDVLRRVTAATYDEQAKLNIFRDLLELSYQLNTLHQKQYEWATKLLEPGAAVHGLRQRRKIENRDKFLEIIRRCTPADIERFFTLHLREVQRSDDFITLLQLNAGGDAEIHSWFISLDDSTKCFVLTLALCSELDRQEFWAKYKIIVKELRKLDASLSLLPLGICRQRATPYVSTEGPIDFVDTRVAKAINDEVARNYREYLVELLPKLKEWSVPDRGQTPVDARSEERKREASQTQAFRTAVARLVGMAGKESLDADISGMLEHWATDPILKIREAVGIALEQTAQDTDSANRALDLLKSWGSGAGNDERSFFKLYATAFPLTRFASLSSGQAVYLRALTYLKFLTKDARGSVRFYTSIAVRKMARKAQFADLEVLLGALANDTHLATRLNAAQALNEARFGNEQEVLNLIERWLISDDENLRWVAICSRLSAGNQSGIRDPDGIQRKVDEIRALLAQDADMVANVFLELIGDDRLKKTSWPILKHLLRQETSNGLRETLITALAHSDFNRLDKKLLARLRTGKTEDERLIAVIRREFWRQRLQMPSDLLMDLCKSLSQGRTSREVFMTLLSLLKPEPEGHRQEFINAVVSDYPENHEILEDLLLKLKRMADSVFQPLCLEIQREALKRVFHNPPVFLELSVAGLERPETSAEMCRVLVSLAQPEPVGYRAELFQALAYASTLGTPLVNRLLSLFRASNNRFLVVLARESTYRLLEANLLSAPPTFFSTILENMEDPEEWKNTLIALQTLAQPSPGGQRRTLVTALASEKATRPAGVEQFLQHPSVRGIPILKGLQFEVRMASLLDHFFVPETIFRLFTPG
jgi:hypothetical protein